MLLNNFQMISLMKMNQIQMNSFVATGDHREQQAEAAGGGRRASADATHRG
jgi:hypothetical protein